jgi:16S rRNA (cytidine1402-2'-O)-methyltransferase
MTQPGQLYLVGTPIGNLQDITLRALSTLKSVDLIAAEDTRHTGKLLQHFQITTPQISYHDHNRSSREAYLLEQLSAGKDLALVTDAGMPTIADPGYELVQACILAGIRVIPIPGVNAATTALAVAGLNSERFCFEGFLSQKSKERREHLEQLQNEPRTLIFYEAPHHLQETLKDLGEVFGAERSLVIARELTKLYEEIWRGNFAEAQEFCTQHPPKGEYTLVVDGYQAPAQLELSETVLKQELETLMSQGISKSQASRQLAQLTGVPRRRLYQLALNLD